MTDGPPIRVLHVLEPEFGWTFSSPDVDGMVGGGNTLQDSEDRAEDLVRTHLAGRREPDPKGRTASSVRFEHEAHELADHATDETSRPGPITPPF